MNERRQITAQILAGFCANNAVFAQNPNHGWGLVNCTDEQVIGYALSLADKILEATASQSPTT